MNPPDWRHLLEVFESSLSDANRTTLRYQIDAARRLTTFMLGRAGPVDEGLLLSWVRERLQRRNLECALGELTPLQPYLRFLEASGCCLPGSLQRLREHPALPAELPGRRPYDPLPSPWPAALKRFEQSLRGLSGLYQSRILRVASDFAAHLSDLGLDAPTEASFLEWLDRQQATKRPTTLARQLTALQRFCQFLQAPNSVNLIRGWRARYPSLAEALRCRLERLEPPPGRPRFHSFLASHIEAFEAFRQSLGIKRARLFPLRLLDRYAAERALSALNQLDAAAVAACLSRFADSRPLTRIKAWQAFHQFFRFLRRRGHLRTQDDPMRDLPRPCVPPFRPHIYTLKEIASLLEAVSTDPLRSPYDRQMFFTILHLIYACGLRLSEPLRLQVRDVDQTARTILIRQTKFGKSRQIPVGRRAAEYLAAHHARRIERLGEPTGEAPFFVRGTGRPVCRQMVGQVFVEARARVGIVSASERPPRIHDLRHTHAVHRLYKWYLDGADPRERLVLLSLYLGHVEVEYTQHYLHLSQDLLRVAGRPLERSIRDWMQLRQEDLPRE